ncbi:MAG: FUSC family protein [Winogradskyella sp.]|uniref:FUSC family protein n=1 Tax=Winogradskyella sp. TaxID=1883156 RepID=UPI0017FA25A2|nr:FUSC family protein [Winogradskyella sp.]MBT8243875.1 FUSC family protein [Winogradskyella sp.]NNK22280.1 FUSC family protein [Winogradskyella sp.]
MKRLLVILGFITSVLAVILAVTPLFKIAVFPVIAAFLCGLGLLYLTKKKQIKTKAIQYVFLLSIISLGFIIYKSVFYKAEIGDTEELEQREDKSEEDAIELLEDIEIDE